MSKTSKKGSTSGGIWNILGVKPNGVHCLDASEINNSKTNTKCYSTSSLRARASRGPATERLVIVGKSTAGKRTVLERLRKASEMPSASGTGGDAASKKAGVTHLVQKRELHQHYKTHFGAHHGCGALYGSIAFHYDDSLYGGDNSLLDVNNEGSSHFIGTHSHHSQKSNTTNASKFSNAINNCIMEVFVCDNFEALDSAFPDIDSLISTVVIFVVDSMEISSASNVLHTWVRAVNDRVKLLIDRENNAGKSKSGGFSLDSGVSQTQSDGNKTVRTVNSLFKSYAPFFSDVHSLVDHRKTEWEMEKSATSSIREAFFDGPREDKEWIRMIAENEKSPVPSFPDSLWCLLPSILMMNKLDLLEEATKSMVQANTAASSATNRIAPLSAALQHGRWLALQRGSAFVAVPSKSHNNYVDALFFALWRYIVYGMVPQPLVRDHVKFHKLLNLKGGTGDGGIDGMEEEESRREVAAMQRRAVAHNLDKSIGDGSIDGDSYNTSVITEAISAVAEESGPKDFIDEEEHISVQLKQLSALLCDEEIASTYRVLPETGGGGRTSLFLPRGLDSPLFVMQGAASVKYIEITFDSLAAITSSLYNTNTDGLNVTNSVHNNEVEGDGGGTMSSHTGHVTHHHAGKQMHELFLKQMKVCLEFQNGSGTRRSISGPSQGQASGNLSQTKMSTTVGNLQSVPDVQQGHTTFLSSSSGKVAGNNVDLASTVSDGEAMIWDE